MRKKLILEAEGQAKHTAAIGQAEADVVRMKKLAEAEGTEKLAIAMAKFNDAAMGVKQLDILKDITIAKYQAFSTALSKADIKWILSGANAQKFFGLNLDAEGGANLEQFAEESGLDLGKIKDLLKKATGK